MKLVPARLADATPAVRVSSSRVSSSAGPAAERWRRWRERYLAELRRLLGEFGRQAARKSQEVSDAVASAVDPHLPAERRRESLSRESLRVVASTPGVSSILNGMRSVAYVRDAAGILAWPPLANPLPVYESMRARER